jgi:hypothetical protein
MLWDPILIQNCGIPNYDDIYLKIIEGDLGEEKYDYIYEEPNKGFNVFYICENVEVLL